MSKLQCPPLHYPQLLDTMLSLSACLIGPNQKPETNQFWTCVTGKRFGKQPCEGMRLSAGGYVPPQHSSAPLVKKQIIRHTKNLPETDANLLRKKKTWKIWTQWNELAAIQWAAEHAHLCRAAHVYQDGEVSTAGLMSITQLWHLCFNSTSLVCRGFSAPLCQETHCVHTKPPPPFYTIWFEAHASLTLVVLQTQQISLAIPQQPLEPLDPRAYGEWRKERSGVIQQF